MTTDTQILLTHLIQTSTGALVELSRATSPQDRNPPHETAVRELAAAMAATRTLIERAAELLPAAVSQSQQSRIPAPSDPHPVIASQEQCPTPPPTP